MAGSEQRAAYLAAQVEAIHQNLRFLEAVVTQPIGLTTDLRSLREAMDLPGAASERDREAFWDLVQPGQDPRPLGLKARAVTSATIDLASALASGDFGFDEQWASRARKVLERVESRLGADARRARAEELRRGLYVIVDPEHTAGRPVAEVAAAAIEGGAAAIQLRDKKSDKGRILATARRLRDICEEKDALLFINDDADIARLCGADGMHVGQTDLPIAQARLVLRPWQLVGRSNALLEEALESESDSADYVAVGAIFPTGTKQRTRPAGLETLRKVKDAIAVPVVAIGGITERNIGEVVAAGADAVCVLSAVCLADDPAAAAARLSDAIARSPGH